MSIQNIHLGKALKLMFLPSGRLKSALREDIRSDLSRQSGQNTEGGGDFHVPFWADAKSHIAGRAHLQVLTKARVASNSRRQRLYPLLSEGFLKWWNEKRRWSNESYALSDRKIAVVVPLGVGDCNIKVKNIISIKVGPDANRYIYPYFAESPALNDEGARLGLWLLTEALTDCSQIDLRILDVLRAAAYGIADCPLHGDEADIFRQKFSSILELWRKLRDEYL